MHDVRLANCGFCSGQEFIERVDRKHLTLKDAPEVARHAIGSARHGGASFRIGFDFEGRNASVGDAAGDDPVEVAEVGGYVQSEAVGCDRLGDMDANCGDFLFGDAASGDCPYAGAFADALRGNAEVFAGEDERLFDQTDEVYRAEVRTALAWEVAAEVEDGVADELARTVVGDVSSAIDLVYLDAFLGEELVGGQDVGTCGVSTEGEDRGMLEEQEGVADLIRLAGGDDSLLDGEAFGIGNAAELEEMDDHAAREVS